MMAPVRPFTFCWLKNQKSLNDLIFYFFLSLNFTMILQKSLLARIQTLLVVCMRFLLVLAGNVVPRWRVCTGCGGGKMTNGSLWLCRGKLRPRRAAKAKGRILKNRYHQNVLLRKLRKFYF